MHYKQTEFYQLIRSSVKELFYLKNIKIYTANGAFDIDEIYESFVSGVEKYLNDIENDNRIGFFSKSSKKTSIYSYVYWVMSCGLINKKISSELVDKISTILIESQKEDGLCWDANVMNLSFVNGDGWGARHFMPQYLIAVERLGKKSEARLNYLAPYHNAEIMRQLLESLDWARPWEASNVVMNIATGLFYERDFLKIEQAGTGIRLIQKWLIENVNPESGMWGRGNQHSRYFKYQMIRGAYHLFYILIYDSVDFPYQTKAIDTILQVQNRYGGYDYQKNSSACEDIDAIEPLIRLSILNKDYRRRDIENSIKKSLGWVVQNQMEDGGCVFRLGEPIVYGSSNMSAMRNESNLFATWFRTLSVCYMYDFLTGSKRNYIDLGGYEYPLYRDK